MVRYADDLVIACRTQKEAEEALEILKQWVKANGLELHPEKTRIANMTEARSHFDFLGYRFYRTKKGKAYPLSFTEKRETPTGKASQTHTSHQCPQYERDHPPMQQSTQRMVRILQTLQ